jgi:hypothetical protein
MLTVIVALFAVALGILTSGIRAPRAVTRTRLGWMSDQWLAEYRASNA